MIPFGVLAQQQQGGVPGGFWEYATLALAESSGDPWQDGDGVQITGGALFVYVVALAEDGYSGLLHKYPWDGIGDAGILVSSLYKMSTPQGSDPDDWITNNLADNYSVGTSPVDYEFTTSGGKSRIITKGTNDNAILYGKTGLMDTSDNECFMILDAIEISATLLAESVVKSHILDRLYVLRDPALGEGGGYVDLSFIANSPSSNRWTVGGVNTDRPLTTPTRFYVYIKDGFWAAWMDGDALPVASGGNMGIGANSRGFQLWGKTYSYSNGLNHDMKQMVVGSMVTSASTATGPWEYVSVDFAEGTGDPWVDGDEIQITGGALLVYKAALAVNGYSGLIHKHPYDGVGTLGSLADIVDVKNSTLKDVDPDTWVDWTVVKVSFGDADISGRSRMHALTGNDRITLSSDLAPQVTDTESFMIIDEAEAQPSGVIDSSGIVESVTNSLWAKDGAGDCRIALVKNQNIDSWDWAIRTGASTYINTYLNAIYPRRVWIYLKANQWAVWLDGAATPAFSGVTNWTSTDGKCAEFQTKSGQYYDHYQKLKQAITGSMGTTI